MRGLVSSRKRLFFRRKRSRDYRKLKIKFKMERSVKMKLVQDRKINLKRMINLYRKKKINNTAWKKLFVTGTDDGGAASEG